MGERTLQNRIKGQATTGALYPPGGTVTKRRTNWAQFHAEMQRNTALPRIETVDELEAAVMTLETDIHTAEVRSTTETVEIFRQDYVGELPHATKLLIRERRSARRRSIRTGDPVDRNALNQLSRRVRAALDEHFNERWRKHTEEINEGAHDRDFWKLQKILRTQRKPIPPIHGERGIVRTNSEKAEAFADSFELQCRENQLDDEDEDHEEEVERRVPPRLKSHTEPSADLYSIFTSDLSSTARVDMDLYADDSPGQAAPL
ncbi:hypothetical protein NQ315_015937 [Exocentrus adspersus]|uniref:Uncharacterized protein n=1 Tax=Exocentrus adspersus TaxID=1586481 RepID=A0AAV8VBS3_9CUCU|nr:hypothetical protein NQ315_015937 [Exocentrus adspersus]